VLIAYAIGGDEKINRLANGATGIAQRSVVPGGIDRETDLV
jgi:hypothetical protein